MLENLNPNTENKENDTAATEIVTVAPIPEQTEQPKQPEQTEQPEQKQVYRWKTDDEIYDDFAKTIKNIKASKKNKKRGLAIKIFAALMSIMFLVSATGLVYVLSGNMDRAAAAQTEAGALGNAATVLSNKDAVEETRAKQSGALEDVLVTIPENTNSAWLTTEEAIAKVRPSVVCIEVEAEITRGSYYGRNRQPYIISGVGTGFIVSEDGYIATNYHVVEGATKITVTLNTGEQHEAEFVGGDEVADLAIIKIEANGLSKAELGDSDALLQGQDVVAIGTPAGIEFAWTATKGIVSAINRMLDVDSQKTVNVIQTDASINPGNSGGPLINMKGQVVGITSMKLADTAYEGMGFAIPINDAIPVFNNIIQNPGITKMPAASSPEDQSTVSFGLEGAPVSSLDAEYYGLPLGWKISRIVEGGACWNSGLQVSDIIVALDGSVVESTEDMYRLKLNYKPGDKVIVTIYRNGDEYDFEITFAAR